jgi:aarF domain-containing kinase
MKYDANLAVIMLWHFFIFRKVLVMDFIEGVPVLKLGDEMAKRGIDPNGAMARIAKRWLLFTVHLKVY